MANAMPDDCPFCIQNGKVEILAEDENGYLTYVLDRTGKKMELRFFFIPKAHIEQFYDLPDDWTKTEKFLLRQVLGLLEWSVDAQVLENWNMSINNGVAAGQKLAHLHRWLIFRIDALDAMSWGIGMAGLIEKVNQQQGTIQHMSESLRACLH